MVHNEFYKPINNVTCALNRFYNLLMNKLNIFISSTCYDLSQVRADLCDFITGVSSNFASADFRKIKTYNF